MRRALIIVASVAAALALVPAAPAVTAKTIRVSVSSGGAEANYRTPQSFIRSSVSRSGRFVVFCSSASNLVGGGTNGGQEIFVHNRKTGKTRLVSVSSSGAEASGASWAPGISGDGRYVVFVSGAPNLVSGDTNNAADIFVRDRALGTTERVSISSAGEQAISDSFSPSISADGDHVAFQSNAWNLVAGDTNSTSDIFVRDRSAGTTERVSISPAGAEGNSGSYEPSISGDGSIVAFSSEASNLVGPSGDTNGVPDIFVRVRSAHKTRRVSISSGGTQGNDRNLHAAISANGRFVAFASHATNLVSGDSNNLTDVFVRDRLLGKTRRVSISSAEAQGNRGSAWPAISAAGRYVAFYSRATNLVRGDTNGSADVFVRDRSAGATRRVSVRFDGTQANRRSIYPEIAGSGRFVAFISKATNLVNGDTNGFLDVFLRGPLF